jgi:superfamily I DNA/RNA helicase
MNPIEIVSASAGSGKTYKLASVLEEAVRGKEVRPQAIIATTFTNKAAAELRERVRQRLLERGLAAEAQQLNAAIMGTVNSVCGRLVRDFAFYLGISPEVRILDKEMADRTLRRALTGVIDRESDAAIARLTESFYEWNIEAFISDVVELARANGMDPSDLAVSRDRCIAELNEILGPPMTWDIGADLERRLEAAIRTFLAYFEKGEDDTGKTGKCADVARDFLNTYKSGKIPPWQKWSALSKLDPGKKSLPAVSPIISLAADHIRHPQFQADLRAAVAAVFDTAACALQSYAESRLSNHKLNKDNWLASSAIES